MFISGKKVIPYIELCGLPASGKSTVFTEVFKKHVNIESICIRSAVLKNYPLLFRICMFMYLTIRWGIKYIYTYFRYLGVAGFFSQTNLRGYIDYISLQKNLVNTKCKLVAYDQGIISTAVSLFVRFNCKEFQLLQFIATLVPENTTLIFLQADVEVVAERNFMRKKRHMYSDTFSRSDLLEYLEKQQELLNYLVMRLKNHKVRIEKLQANESVEKTFSQLTSILEYGQ